MEAYIVCAVAISSSSVASLPYYASIRTVMMIRNVIESTSPSPTRNSLRGHSRTHSDSRIGDELFLSASCALRKSDGSQYCPELSDLNFPTFLVDSPGFQAVINPKMMQPVVSECLLCQEGQPEFASDVIVCFEQKAVSISRVWSDTV